MYQDDRLAENLNCYTTVLNKTKESGSTGFLLHRGHTVGHFSSNFASWQAVQRSPLFPSAVSRGPNGLFQCVPITARITQYSIFLFMSATKKWIMSTFGYRIVNYYLLITEINFWHLYVYGLLYYRMTLGTVPSDRDVRARSTAFRVDLGTRYVTICVVSRLLQEGVGGSALGWGAWSADCGVIGKQWTEKESFQQYFYNRYKILHTCHTYCCYAYHFYAYWLYFIYVWHVYVSPKKYKWSGTFVIKDGRYAFTFIFLSSLTLPLPPTNCRCRGLFLHLIKHTVRRTSLDEWSACRSDPYLTSHNTKTDIYASGRIRTHNPVKRTAADPPGSAK
jgi:hypothetical protein